MSDADRNEVMPECGCGDGAVREWCIYGCPEAKVGIRAAAYPGIHRAFDLVSHVGGGRAGHETYFVPACHGQDLAEVDAAIRSLDGWNRDPVPEPTDFETFCVGEEEAMAEIAGRTPELGRAAGFLGLLLGGDMPMRVHPAC